MSARIAAEAWQQPRRDIAVKPYRLLVYRKTSPSELSSRLALESSSFPAGGNGDENTRIPVFGYKDKHLYSILQTNSSKITEKNGEPRIFHTENGDIVVIMRRPFDIKDSIAKDIYQNRLGMTGEAVSPEEAYRIIDYIKTNKLPFDGVVAKRDGKETYLPLEESQKIILSGDMPRFQFAGLVGTLQANNQSMLDSFAIAKQMEKAGQEMGLAIHLQREDIFQAMHRV